MVATIRRTVWNEILPFNPEEVGVDSQKEDNLRRQFWDVMIDKLLKLRDLEDNWDENGARAPSKRSR